MTELVQLYRLALSEPTDITEHLPMLRDYASQCEHVTEFGVRRAVSTRALAMGLPAVLRSYDIAPTVDGERVINAARSAGVDAQMIRGDTRKCRYDPTDLLFVDTLHTEAQVRRELAAADKKVRKWIIFHDTVSNGTMGEDGGQGILPAIQQFQSRNPHWVCEVDRKDCNGLMVLGRQS